MMTIRDDIFAAHKRGFSDARGYRKDDPTLKQIEPFSENDFKNQLMEVKRTSINRYTGKQDASELDKNFRKVVTDRAYASGLLRGISKSYMTPEKLFQVARAAYKA